VNMIVFKHNSCWTDSAQGRRLITDATEAWQLKEQAMFTVHCDTCDTTRLLGPRRIIGMDNTDQGIVVHFRCFCGAEATVLTGRAAHRPVPAPSVDEPAPVDAPAPAPVPATVPAYDERVLAPCGASTAA
jgi:hypothetical protein